MTLREHRNTNMSDDLETAPLLTTYTDDISRDEKELEESLDSNDPGVELAVVCEQPVHTAIVSSSGATQNAERNAALHGIGCMVIDPAGVEDPSSMGDLETFYCKVCLENCQVELATSFSNGACTHVFCRECLHSYVRVRVVEGQVAHPCPLLGHDGCTATASREDIHRLVSSDIFEKYERFSKMKSDSNYRDCPQCHKLLLGSAKVAQMRCDACGCTFCFFHATAHEGTSCREYARRMRREDALNTHLLAKTTKPCPLCRTPTEKLGGCNHMTCSACQHEWCWLCGRTMGKHHFAAWNVMGCPSALFRPEMSRAQLACYKASYMPFLLVMGGLYLFATALGLIILAPLCPVVLCKRGSQCLSPRYCCRGVKDWIRGGTFVGGYAIAIACTIIWGSVLLPLLALSICYWIRREAPFDEIVRILLTPLDVFHFLRRT